MSNGKEIVPLTKEQAAVVATAKRKFADKKKASQATWYLKIPGDRITCLVVHRVPPAPFLAYLAIWQQAKLDRKETVVVRPKTLARFGISPRNFRRHIVTLEDRGLISVTRAPGQKIRIFLRDPLRIDSPST